ncbi:hypothetical protein F4814DRAFT_195651 [Daldinia grandis]|nr:hypothetical protein F4814DRAFT_195651 [Daldinia grandis]
MRVQYDNQVAKMNHSAIQRRTVFNSPVPFHTLQSESVQLNTGRLPPVIPCKRLDSAIRLTDTSVSPYSPISERYGSSFSQESTAEAVGECFDKVFAPSDTKLKARARCHSSV